MPPQKITSSTTATGTPKFVAPDSLHTKIQSPHVGGQDSLNGGETPADALTGGPATGDALTYLAPGIMARVGGGTSVYGFVQLPIYQNVNSLQLSARYTLSLGVRQSF